MIPPRNPWYRRALAAPHNPYTRVEVWRDGVQKEELTWRERGTQKYNLDMPVFYTGSVRATLGSRVTRSLTMSVPEYLFPRKVDDLLNPYGTELRAFRGVRYGNGSPDEFPVFVGPILRAKPARKGDVTIEAVDASRRVSGAGFAFPMPSQTGTLVVDEFERLVLDAYPRAVFGDHSPLTALVPDLSYDDDRGAALDELVKTANAFWYTLADGRYVIRSVPWSVAPTTGAIPMTDGPGGTLITAYPDRDASDLVNRWTIISDRPDGGEPFYATAEDTDPTSPTWVGGPFGVRSKQVRVTGAANQGQLQYVATAQVQRTRSLVDSWSITCVPDGSIELGDPLDITARGDYALQIVAAYTMPLDTDTDMTIEGRGLNSLVEVDA